MNGQQAPADPAMAHRRGVLRLLPADGGWAQASRCLFGRSLSLAVPGSAAWQVSFHPARPGAALLEVRARWGGHDFDIQLVDMPDPGELADAMAPDVPQEVRGAMLLLCVQPFAGALERVTGWRLQGFELLEPGTARAPSQPHDLLGVTVTVIDPAAGRRVVTAMLRSTSAGGWRFLVDCLLPALRPAGPLLDLEGHLRVFALSRRLAPAELQGLESGDIVLLRGSTAHPLRVCGVAAFGGGWIKGLQFEHTLNALRVVGAGPLSTPGRLLSEDAMDSDELGFPGGAASPLAPPGPYPEVEGQRGSTVLDGLRLNVHVELLRLSLPLSTVQALCEGQVLDTGQALDADRVLLWCGGRCIGAGQLLAVGDAVGVRVLALHRDGQGTQAFPGVGQEGGTSTPDGSHAAAGAVAGAHRNNGVKPGAAGRGEAAHASAAAETGGAQPR